MTRKYVTPHHWFDGNKEVFIETRSKSKIETGDRDSTSQASVQVVSKLKSEKTNKKLPLIDLLDGLRNSTGKWFYIFAVILMGWLGWNLFNNYKGWAVAIMLSGISYGIWKIEKKRKFNALDELFLILAVIILGLVGLAVECSTIYCLHD